MTKKRNKKWGFRGMNFDKASVVKRDGHKTENILASLINIPLKNIVTGTGKTDLITNDGKRVSLKSSHDAKGRSQICLYSYDSDYFKSTVNGSTKRMRECLAVFPETQGEYKSKRAVIKKLLQKKMIELQKYINADIRNKKEFLEFIFFTDHNNKKIDFLIITDSSLNFHVFTTEEVLDTFCKKTIVVNSTARHAWETPSLKVLFKGKNEKGKYVNLIENEVRTSTHYRRFLSVANKTKYLFLFTSNIKPRKVVKQHIILYGKANKTFNFSVDQK